MAAIPTDGDGKTVLCTSAGSDETGDEMAVFKIAWSFKAESSAGQA